MNVAHVVRYSNGQAVAWHQKGGQWHQHELQRKGEAALWEGVSYLATCHEPDAIEFAGFPETMELLRKAAEDEPATD